MKAWVTAMGKPLICGIVGNDGFKSFYYEDEDSDPNEGRIIKAGTLIFGVNPIV